MADKFDSDRIAELKSEWEHASRIAFESIGQPDRAANVAYRDELWRRLCEARGDARCATDEHR
ncbi:hypothetical protein I5H27_gp040 [Mycobacterium phage DillTech15]|uniref:Uncharacterized protein n=1 Tax=Mycobacterium phage DillTech15 TaxID=2163591 RepID=A0A2S1PB12_9CAUD|nr:hypothetical protein I5H27_gp040 [Mycobacterium phage DillTech15]AWH13742.1 hypothetical protein SEA_DILLTECH15_40 [Mycobacterium phage DillTech15]